MHFPRRADPVSDASGGHIPWRLSDLPAIEKFVIWSFRHWHMGPEGQNAVWREFGRRFSAKDRCDALRAFERLARTLSVHARRSISIRFGECGWADANELCLARVVSSLCQDQVDIARERALWLVPRCQRQALLSHASTFATAWNDNDRAHLDKLALVLFRPPRDC